MTEWLGYFSTQSTPAGSAVPFISTIPSSSHNYWVTSDSRLSISTTPQVSHCGNTLLLLAGHVYNHKDIRNSLRFDSWHGDSPAETLVEAFAQRGLSLVLDLRGAFAFAVYDCRSGQLLLGRDRVGIHPLYLSWHEDGLFFSTELSDLIHLQRFTRSSISQYLSFGHINHTSTFPSPDTVGVFCFPPGCAARINSSRSHDYIHYWPPQPRPEWTPLSFSKYLSPPSLLRQQLDQLIDTQLTLVNHPVCLLDDDPESHCLASLINNIKSDSFNCLSLVLPGEFIQQSEISTGQSYLSSHETIVVTSDAALSVIEDTLVSPNFLSLLDPALFLRLYFASSQAPCSLFSSLGSQELYANNDLCKLYGLPDLFNFLPLSLLSTFLNLSNSTKFPRQYFSSTSCTLSASVLLAGDPHILPLLDPSLPLPSLPHFNLDQLPNKTSRMSWIGLRGLIEPLYIPILCSTLSASKSPFFAPFLDHIIVELTLRISEQNKRQYKNLLFAACSDLLPTFPFRPSSPRTFSEIHTWMCGPLRTTCLSRLDALQSSGIFNSDWLQFQLSSFKSGTFHSTFMWRLVLLGEHYQRLQS